MSKMTMRENAMNKGVVATTIIARAAVRSP